MIKDEVLSRLRRYGRKFGFTLKKDDQEYRVTGSIVGVIIPGGSYEGICLDHRDCFDKASKCPLQLPFPQNDAQLAFLLEKIDWLRTDTAYPISNEYQRDSWVTDYPKEVDQ